MLATGQSCGAAYYETLNTCMTNIPIERSISFWGNTAPIMSENLPNYLCHYDFHYNLTIDRPRPRPADWTTPFGEDINSCDLFRHGRRFTTERPGWLPLRYRDNHGRETLAVLIAVPPGGLRHFVSESEPARLVFEQAARNTFIDPRTRVRMITPMQRERLIESIDLSTVEFTTAFVREHHESWDCTPELGSRHGRSPSPEGCDVHLLRGKQS